VSLSSEDKWYRHNFIGGIALLIGGIAWLVLTLL
jgi:hypothetical protein